MDPDQLIRELAKPICANAWKGVSYDSEHDTPETVKSAHDNNKARKAFCDD